MSLTQEQSTQLINIFNNLHKANDVSEVEIRVGTTFVNENFPGLGDSIPADTVLFKVFKSAKGTFIIQPKVQGLDGVAVLGFPDGSSLPLPEAVIVQSLVIKETKKGEKYAQCEVCFELGEESMTVPVALTDEANKLPQTKLKTTINQLVKGKATDELGILKGLGASSFKPTLSITDLEPGDYPNLVVTVTAGDFPKALFSVGGNTYKLPKKAASVVMMDVSQGQSTGLYNLFIPVTAEVKMFTNGEQQHPYWSDYTFFRQINIESLTEYE